jgi:hypothetical protein
MSKYDRPLPAGSLGLAALVAVVVAGVLLSAWELHWREFGSEKSYRNSGGLWATERRRIDNGEGDATVLIGSSRMQFDLQLDVWEQESGERPIQLAMVGTSPLTAMESLADDPDFTGRLLVGVAPDLFFSGLELYGEVFDRYRDETPSQWLGQRISLLIEPHLAFYNKDYALIPILRRQPLPPREGVFDPLEVRKLDMLSRDRNIRMWRKVEEDRDYQALAEQIWAQFLPLEIEDQEQYEMQLESYGAQIDRAVAATRKLVERGVDVIFVRFPSVERYRESERLFFPRSAAWDLLIEKTGALGIHFEDHPELQGYELPEWSHLSGSEADRFTAALYEVVERELRIFKERSGNQANEN